MDWRMRLFGIFIHRPGGIDSAKRKDRNRASKCGPPFI
jgi:hypothetical protein